MTAQPVSTALGDLGRRLRALREQAGLTGAEFSALLGDGWSQPKISKIENGRQLPAEADVRAWVDATAGEVEPLLALRERAVNDYRSHKDRIRRAGGPVEHQNDLTALTESCTFLAEFQPASVPGRVQTASYMRELAQRDPTMAEDGITTEIHGHVIAAKLRRQAILYEPGREFVHVVTEAALRLRFGAITSTTMRGQLGHLADLATLSAHTFGVIPFAVTCPVMPSNFAMFDRDLVRIETAGGTLQLTDSDALARYARWLDQLVDVALTGSAAADFCREVALSLPD